jgi:hypothetical protein
MSFTTSNMLGAVLNDFTTVTTTDPVLPNPPLAVGTRAFGNSGTEWIYVQASAAISAGFFCVISITNTAAHVTTTNGLRGLLVGVPLVAIPSGSYGWLQVKGPCAAAQVLASAAANARLNTTATAGALDDDGGAGTKEVLGVALTTARAASQGNAPAMLNYPAIGVTL